MGDPQLSSTNSESWIVKSIHQILIDLNHMNSIITILKVDVEGAEWDAVESMLNNQEMVQYISTGHIRQLLVEWHWDPDSR